MNICYLVSNFSASNSGGIGTYVDTIGNELGKRGHSVTVMSPHVSGRIPAYYRLFTLEIETKLERRRLDIARAMYNVLTELEIDVIEATDWGMEAFFCVSPSNTNSSEHATLRKRTTIRFHTPESVVCNLNGESRMFDSATVIASEKPYFESTYHFTSPSVVMAKIIDKTFSLGEKKIKIIPNPICLDEIRKENICWTGRKSQIIGFFGRLEKRKGVFEFAERLNRFLCSGRNLSVLFIGADTRTVGGSVGRELRNIFGANVNRVHFLGHCSGKDRYRALTQCRCVVFPSLWENFSYACLETMACGIPILASKNTGFEEILSHENDGILFDPFDSNDFSSAVDNALCGRYDYLGRNAKHSVGRFDVKAIVSEMEQYYNEIIINSHMTDV